jgi:hypothetical protein
MFDETQLSKYQASHDISKPLDSLPKVEQRAVLVEVARKIKTAVFE